MPKNSPTTVLHVVDRSTGGVPRAVTGYISNSPGGIAHHILSPFEYGAPIATLLEVEAHHHDLGRGTLHRVRRIRRVAREVGADVIHAHSSFSGGYVRLATSRRRRRLLYTPHCFAFERTDVSGAKRGMFITIENALAWNTSLTAACSPGEKVAADKMRGLRRRSIYLPSFATVAPRTDRPVERQLRRVGMAGRVSPQKDPNEFLELFRVIRTRVPDIHGVWIGDGDRGSIEQLEREGVLVTGWVSGESLNQSLDQLDLYIHSAAWEGFPLSVLDAHARRVPILVRPIRAFGDLPPELTTRQGLVSLLASIAQASFSTWAQGNLLLWDRVMGENTPMTQRDVLERIWNAS